MTWLIVGVDRRTLAPWHKNVLERDPDAAARTALAHADTDGIDLVVAAVIGPNTTIVAADPRGPEASVGTQRHRRQTSVPSTIRSLGAARPWGGRAAPLRPAFRKLWRPVPIAIAAPASLRGGPGSIKIRLSTPVEN